MTGVQMAVFDLDGTLLQHGALTGEAVRMLRTLRKNGVRVVIATGRHRGTVPLRLKSPRLVDYLICSNGALVAPAGGSPLQEKTLSGAELKALMDLGDRFGCRYSVNIGSTTFLSRQAPLQRPKTDWLSDTKKYFWRYYMYPLHTRTVEGWGDYLARPDAGAEKVIHFHSCIGRYTNRPSASTTASTVAMGISSALNTLSHLEGAFFSSSSSMPESSAERIRHL